MSSILTERTNISHHLKSLNIHVLELELVLETIGNPGSGKGQECGGVKLVNGTPNHPLWIIGSPTAIHIHVYINKR